MNDIRPTTRARRGVALLFALVTVALASVVALSYAKTRDVTLIAADELREAAEARNAAKSGLAIASAMLDAGVLPSASDHGVLFADLPLGNAHAAATLLDLETSLPATAYSRGFNLVVAGASGSLQSTSTAVGRIPAADAATLVDVDLSEFALFASESIDIAPDAALARWSNSPFAVLREPIAIATAALDPAHVRIGRDADAIDFVIGQAAPIPTTSIAADEALADGHIAIPDTLVLPAAPLPPELLGATSADPITLDGVVQSSTRSTTDIRIAPRASVTVRGSVTIAADADFRIEPGARLIVEGSLALLVGDDLIIDGADIEVAPGGSLVAYIGGDLEMASAFVGPLRTDASEGRDATGLAAWDGGAERVIVYSMQTDANRGDELASRWTIRGSSVVKATLYAPTASIRMEGTSTLYGRAAAQRIELASGSALFYDPALDDRQGFTATGSGIYNGRGRVHSAIRAFASLDPTALVQLAHELGARVQSVARGHPLLELSSDAAHTAERIAAERQIAAAAERASSILRGERIARRAGNENGRDDGDDDERSKSTRRGSAPPRVLSVGGNHSSDR